MTLPGLFIVTLCLTGLAAVFIIGRALWAVSSTTRHGGDQRHLEGPKA